MNVDLRVLELLSSKLCHDLISPVSAVNNGVELIQDIGGEMEGEALKLVADSAANAARRLRMFRVAYGRAGSEENLPLKDMRLVAEHYFSVGKTRIVWREDLVFPGLEETRGALKTIINALIMAEEILAYGGTVTLSPPKEGGGCVIEVMGRGALLSESFRDALEDKVAVESLTPRTIQPYITGQFARAFGLSIVCRQVGEGRLEVALQPPPSAYDVPQSV